jgi:segregation and condensation protein A
MSPLQPIIIKVDSFEGPMDLLIELIKKREMSIYDLSISTLTGDFIANLNFWKEDKIELTSQFLETASMLLRIKTEMLLPQENKADPRDLLIKEIEDYQRYKDSIERFKEMQYIEQRFLKRSKYDKIKKNKEGSLSDIFKSFDEILRKKKFKERNKKLDELSKKLSESNFTIEDRIEHLKSFKEPKQVEILFDDIDDLEEMVVTFSALLELVRIQFFSIYFSDDNNSLYIEPKKGDGIFSEQK